MDDSVEAIPLFFRSVDVEVIGIINSFYCPFLNYAVAIAHGHITCDTIWIPVLIVVVQHSWLLNACINGILCKELSCLGLKLVDIKDSCGVRKISSSESLYLPVHQSTIIVVESF